MTDYQKKVAEAITALHGCDCSYLETASVIEMMDKETVWNGQVEVFELHNHTEATRAYGWGYDDETGKTHYVAILGINPPVEGPREAVQIAIASGQINP